MRGLSRLLDMPPGTFNKDCGPESSETKSSASVAIESIPEAETLSTFEVLYHLHKEDGDGIIGNAQSAFATFDPAKEKITVYAKSEEHVEVVPHRTVSVLAALECAKAEGASFTVCGTQVICVLKDVSAQGSSYGEAALRALLKFQRRTIPDGTLSS